MRAPIHCLWASLGLALSTTGFAQSAEHDRADPFDAIREGRPALSPGTDDAVPAPRGEVFFQPRDVEPFTGLSDEEVANSDGPGLAGHDPHAQLHFTEQPSGTWIRGRTYKASVNADGFQYIPFLGSSAPRNWPVAFRLVSARLGDTPIELNESAVVTRTGDRTVLSRGPVDVIYDFSLESVEQSFAFDPRGRAGDLVLTLSVTSDLAPTSRDGGFRFDGPNGGLDYGAAVVLDDAGRTAHVPATLVDDRLELTVPSSFIAAANGPILVDPVITTFTVDNVSGHQEDVEVAYDVTNDAFTYVYEDTFSGGDIDMYLTTVTSGGVFMDGRYVDSSTEVWRDPNIANLNAANRNLIVAHRFNATTGYAEVVGRIYDVSTQTIMPEILIGEATASWENFRPDVGGNSSGQAFTLFVVIWERHFSTTSHPRYRTVLPDGTLGPIQFFDTGSFERTSVAISESTGDPTLVNRWNVVYRSRDLSNNVVSLRGITLNAGGAIVAGPSNLLSLPAGSNLDEIDVSESLSLDGLAPTYAATYDLYGTAIEDTMIVMCRNNQLLTQTELQRSEHAEIATSQLEAQLATTREDFIVTYVDTSTHPRSLFISTFDLTEGAFPSISERRTLFGDTGPGILNTGEGPALASRFSGGLYSSRITGIGWGRFVNNQFDAVGATHIADAPFAQGVQYCYGSPNSSGDRGFLALYGTRSTTTPKQLVATALPPNSFGFFFCGRGFANTPNPGGSQGTLCVGGLIGRYSNFAASSGAEGRLALTIDPTMLPQPFGPVAAMLGDSWQFQCWHRDVAGGQVTSNFTNAVSLYFY